ncbi:DNA primase family protein [Spirosoma spitsbergense]|uniref:DNA primase family protein n=1 Tax=Spirosoma spitsbergense TaxID=431554 RepID=UPI000380A07B|nr:phage/plasmid primase, P4 family [Spirosoma spitsbergense]
MNKNQAPLSVSYKEIYAHATELSKPVNLSFEHPVVTEQLLNAIQPVDFRRLASLEDKEKTSLVVLYVLVIDQVAKLAQQHNWGLCQHDGYAYLYNGQYWLRWSRDELRQFLCRAASKLGVDDIRSKDHMFVDHLYKQFIVSSPLPAPATSVGTTLINLLNGTLEINNGKVRKRGHEANDFQTYLLSFDYDPQADCPRFKQFLQEVLPDEDLQKVLAEFIGWVFMPTTLLKLEKCLILHGTGANGKSVFFDIIFALLGSNNITCISLRNLCDSVGQYRARLSGKLLNYSTELSAGLETDLFKQLASGEPIEARQLYKEPYTVSNYARLMFNTNELPKQVEQSEGYYRRFIIIPFLVTIPEDEQDKQLAQNIIAQELPGILNWVLEGAQRLLAQKRFTVSESVNLQTEQFRRDSDSTALFLQEEGYTQDPHEHLTVKELYIHYEQYCHECRNKPVSRNNFFKRLEAQGVRFKRTSKGQEAFLKKPVTAES